MKKLNIIPQLILFVIVLVFTSCSVEPMETEDNLPQAPIAATPITTNTTENTSNGQTSDNTTTTTNDTTIANFELEILDHVNAYRIGKKLSPLELLDIIKIPAKDQTVFMIETGELEHFNFEERAAYLYNNASATDVVENIAIGFDSAAHVVQTWIDNPTDKANMEKEVTHFNIYLGQCENGLWYCTVMFINR